MCACGLFDEPPTFAGANYGGLRRQARGKIPTLCYAKSGAPEKSKAKARATRENAFSRSRSSLTGATAGPFPCKQFLYRGALLVAWDYWFIVGKDSDRVRVVLTNFPSLPDMKFSFD
jgi:hypothetical protein